MVDKIKAALLGVAIGDAVGVPVEFKPRSYLNAHPVKDMMGHGSHNQPVGTWSDDSSLTFCLAESLTTGYNLQDLGNRFVNWYQAAYWTAHNEVFDVGIATSKAIWRLKEGFDPIKAGFDDESSNGNGSLMRILPLVFAIQSLPIEERFERVRQVSSLTHRHIRSVLGCFIYLEIAIELLRGADKFEAYNTAKNRVNQFLKDKNVCPIEEINKYHRILVNPIGDYDIKPIYDYSEAEIYSTGYVLHTLEASIWCLLTTDSFKEAVLKAVNLGDDTDTTGAVTGGLAGLLYGVENMPIHWVWLLARKEDILDLAERLNQSLE